MARVLLTIVMPEYDLYARYLCSRDALGLKAEHVGQARRATIGYLVYKNMTYVKCKPSYLKYCWESPCKIKLVNIV